VRFASRQLISVVSRNTSSTRYVLRNNLLIASRKSELRTAG
jgi:hypothetical protein